MTMNTSTILDIAFIMLGVVAFSCQGEYMIDGGPLHATVEKQETIPLSPVVGGVAWHS
jgi:hypothetical protein